MSSFVQLRKDDWRKLEQYIERLTRTRARLTPDEFRELNRLYRRAATDLAMARQHVRDERVALYLNHLMVRAHGLIYRTDKARFYNIVHFYRYQFPAMVRQFFPYVLTAFLIFFVMGSLSFVTSYMDESFSSLVAPGMRERVIQRENWTENIVGLNPIASSGIMVNNIMVTFLAFALGITAGLGTVAILALNGLSIGAVISLCVKHKFTPILVFVAAHGVLELAAIFIAGAAGLLIGKALLIPEALTRKHALIVNGRMAVQLILGCIPMLAIAALIEGFISPSNISPYYKFAVAIMSAVLLWLYFSGRLVGQTEKTL